MRTFRSAILSTTLSMTMTLLALSKPGFLSAATYCVSNSTELQTALNNAETDGEDSEVRVEGVLMALNTTVEYDVTLIETAVDAGSLTVVGGYNNGCSARSGITQMSSGTNGVLGLYGASRSIRVRDIQFNGATLSMSDNVAGTVCRSNQPDFEIDRIVMNNGLLASSFKCHDLDVRNSLFTNGISDSGQAEVSLRASIITSEDEPIPAVTLVNNTISNGQLNITSCCDRRGNARIYNSIFQNDGNEIRNQAGLSIYNSRYDSLTHVNSGALVDSGNNTSAGTNLDSSFRPNPGSAMINSGTGVVPGGLADLDVYRGDRHIGALVDIGAAESVVDGSGGYTVSNTNSSGSGSLSAAIALANQDPAVNFIRFNIPGACPHRIAVTTPLLVADTLRIDGHTQPGSSSNTNPVGWDAAPCIILDGVNTSSSGIVTESSLDGKYMAIVGLAFERFDAAIVMIAGEEHSIYGNQFGGQVGDSGPTLRANNNAISTTGTSAVIGGSALWMVNLIGGSNADGILITSFGVTGGISVANNVIGTDKNGSSALPNLDGIRISNTSRNDIRNNRIRGNTRDGVVLRGEEAFGNVIDNNDFGSPFSGFLQPSGNGRMGVFIENSAHDNTITGNRFGDNGDTGVRVMSTAGGHNLVSGNTFGRNPIGIDLGANGVTPNAFDGGFCDPIFGCAANNEINYPNLISAEINPGGIVPIGRNFRVQGALTSLVSNAPYRLEFYINDSCNGSGHGEGQRLLGSASVTVANSGLCSTGLGGLNCSASFNAYFPDQDIELGQFVSAITIDQEGNTSEFAACTLVVDGSLTNSIFKNGFE